MTETWTDSARPPGAQGKASVVSLYRRYERVFICAGLLALFLAGHWVLNELASLRARRYLPLLFEDHVPFLPPFIVVYLGSFLLVFTPAFVIRDRAAFRRTARGFLLLILVSFAFFLAYPLTVRRIESPESPSLFVGLLLWFQSHAKPHNTFPSLHVALLTLAAASCLAHERGAGILMTIFAALVALSTLFLKLHVVLDVVAGLALALLTWLWLLWRGARPGSPIRRGETGRSAEST